MSRFPSMRRSPHGFAMPDHNAIIVATITGRAADGNRHRLAAGLPVRAARI